MKNPKGDFDDLRGYEDSDFENYPKATWKDNLITLVEIVGLCIVGFCFCAIVVSAIVYMVEYSKTPATVWQQRTGIVLLALFCLVLFVVGIKLLKR